MNEILRESLEIVQKWTPKPQKLLYIVGGTEPPYKIGIAMNPDERARQIRAASGRPEVRLIHKKTCLNASASEECVHRKLAKHRTCGEWFDTDINTIMCAINEVFRFQRRLN